MDMAGDDAGLFPRSPRVFYEKAPLVEVICQLRYPPILAIQARPPADFQERIRATFPLMEETSVFPPEIELPVEVRRVLAAQAGTGTYQFFSEDRLQTVTFGRDALSYSTKRYVLWDDFFATLAGPISALVDIYKPSFYNRIGLRYIDAINREQLGLTGFKWSDLFRREILGELVIAAFEENLQACSRQIRVTLPSTGSILLQHGLANIAEKPGLSYMVDFDFYQEGKIEVENAAEVLNRFHDVAGRAFRWCISESLHHALVPRPIDDAKLGRSRRTASP
jgi:uncharacterized protein (TIGR04255 family)